MTRDKDVFAEIKSIITENGDIKESTRNRLILLAITELHSCFEDVFVEFDEQKKVLALVKENSDKIKELEKNNIILWVKAHPAYTAGIAILTLTFWRILTPLAHYLLTLAGVPKEILVLVFQ